MRDERPILSYGRAARRSWRPGFYGQVFLYFVAPFIIFAIIVAVWLLVAVATLD